MTSPYEKGTLDANARFGVRVAASVNRMPDAHAHLGASRFTTALEHMNSPQRTTPQKEHRLERPSLWGPSSSVESGGASNFDPALSHSGA